MLAAVRPTRNDADAEAAHRLSGCSTVPEEDSLMSEGFLGDRIQVAIRLRPLQKTADPMALRNGSMGSPPRNSNHNNPASCLLLPVRRTNTGAHMEETMAWTIQGDDTIIQKGPGRKVPKKSLFTLDSVFEESVKTQQIYEKVARPIIQSVLAGRHGTIFAYGQTSSGKTYTMQGGNDIEDADEGLIQLSLYDLFDAIESSSSRDWEVKVQYFEVYCEEVRDLLAATAPESSPPRRAMSALIRRQSSTSSSSSSLSSPTKKRQRASSLYSASSDNASVGSVESHKKNLVRLPSLKVLEDRNGNVLVNAREKKVTCVEECLALLRKGNFNRASAATNANEHSSRSHAIFRVTLHSRAKASDTGSTSGSGASVVESTTTRVSVLNLVDLAGSENCSRTALQGSVVNANTRKREGGKINQSLLSLSRCIHALSLNEGERPNHISFRDSKLTRILKTSLSGEAAMAILCCCSIAKKDIEETRSTLKFASNAKQIQIKPVVNEIVDDKEALRRLRKELFVVKQSFLDFQSKFSSTPQEQQDSPGSIKMVSIPGTPVTLPESPIRNAVLEQQKIAVQRVIVGRISRNSTTKSTSSKSTSSMGSEDTPTMQPLVVTSSKLKGTFCASPPSPPHSVSENREELDESTRHSVASFPPIAEVEILDASSAAGEDDHHDSFRGSRAVAMDEQRANYLEERIETTEALVERMFTELNTSRHFMLEARAVNSELQEQVTTLQQELTATEERPTPFVFSGAYFFFCIMLYAFGLKDWFICAVIFFWLSLQVSSRK